MVWVLVLGLVVAIFLLLAMAVAAVCIGALVWLFLAAAHDRLLAHAAGVGYWRWWADRLQHLLFAADRGRSESALDEGVRRRTITRLEAQSTRLARRIDADKASPGRFGDWARRQDERRLEELNARLEGQRDALFGHPEPPKPHHRPADSDREETVAVLSGAHEEGRIDAAELEERVGRAYRASTHAELEGLLADLRGRANGGGYGTSGQRVSDCEREGAVSVLRAALDEGRISADEFSERTQRAYGARFAEDIADVLDDLPDSYVKRAHFG